MMKPISLLLLSSIIVSAQDGGNHKPSGKKHPGGGDKSPWERISRYDENKDGSVTKEEFKSSNAERALARFDSNKDGILTKSEVETVSKSGGGKRADNAPAAGTIAPKVKAKVLDSEEFIDLGAIKKNTVLIFGSYT